MTRQVLGRVAAAVLAAGFLAIPTVSPAFAADASGCSGVASSSDEHGTKIDNVTAPGPGGTAEDPFEVDLNGPVSWSGETTSVIKNGSWKVSIGGVPISGSFENDEGNRTGNGTETVADRIPGLLAVFLQGGQKLLVTVDITGSGGQCAATVWIKNVGSSATASPMWFAGIGMAVLGLLGLVWMVSGTTQLPPGSRS